MSNSVTIENLRFSVIWAESFLEMLQCRSTDRYPMGFAGDWDGYRRRFSALQEIQRNRKDPQQRLTLPWRNPKANFFWTTYIGNKLLINLGTNNAWKHQIPFRVRPELDIIHTGNLDEDTELVTSVEGFLFPSGMTLVVTFTLKFNPPTALERGVSLACKAREEWQYVLEVPDKRSSDEEKRDRLAEGRLDRLAGECLEYLRVQVLGNEDAPVADVIRYPLPFSIATFIQGGGVNPNIPLDELEPGVQLEARRALQVLTEWRCGWDNLVLPEIGESQHFLKSKRESSVLFAGKRGRAAWNPEHFARYVSRHPLSCYHRNLVAASVQVESLAAFAAHIAADPAVKERRTLEPTDLKRCARYAAKRLSFLYIGNRGKTYRSDSVRAQIDQHPFRSDIETVLAHFNMPPLGQNPE